MVITVDLDGNVSSVPASVAQGTALHDVTVIAPFTTSACALRIKPVSEEWLDDNIAAAMTTKDGKGMIFTTEIPGHVTELAGRVLYQLVFTSQDGDVVKSKIGSLSVTPAILANAPKTIAEFSQYSLEQVYRILANVSNNIRGFRKTLGNTRMALPLTVTIPLNAWDETERSAVVNVPELTDDAYVVASFYAEDASEADRYIGAGIYLKSARDSFATFRCKELPAADVKASLLVYFPTEVVDEPGGGGGDSPLIPAPVISISGSVLTISAGSAINALPVDRYDIYALINGVATKVHERFIPGTIDLVGILPKNEECWIYVTAENTTYALSAQSNIVFYDPSANTDSPYLAPPVISLSGDVLSISPGVGSNAVISDYSIYYQEAGIEVRIGGTTAESIDLRTFGITAGTYLLYVKARNFEHDIYSEASNRVEYVVTNATAQLAPPKVRLDGDMLYIEDGGSLSVLPEYYTLVADGTELLTLTAMQTSYNIKDVLYYQSNIKAKDGVKVWVYATATDTEGNELTSASSSVVSYNYKAFIEKPVISIDGDMLNIEVPKNNVTAMTYYVYVASGSNLLSDFTGETTYDLSECGSGLVYVRAYSEPYKLYSEFSDKIEYIKPILNAPTISLSGYTLTIKNGVGSTIIPDRYKLYIGGTYATEFSGGETITSSIIDALDSRGTGTHMLYVVAESITNGITSNSSNSVRVEWLGFTLNVSHYGNVPGYYWIGAPKFEYDASTETTIPTGYAGIIPVENEYPTDATHTKIEELPSDTIVSIWFGAEVGDDYPQNILAYSNCTKHRVNIGMVKEYNYFTDFGIAGSDTATVTTRSDN